MGLIILVRKRRFCPQTIPGGGGVAVVVVVVGGGVIAVDAAAAVCVRSRVVLVEPMNGSYVHPHAHTHRLV